MTSELFQDNYEAKCAYQILKSMNRPVFLTGRAGTGKSTFIEWAKTITKKCLVLAPTAVAARHIGGRTIHSVFKLPPRLIYREDHEFFSYLNYSNRYIETMRLYELIIIDEVSMVNSSVMYCVDEIFQRICENDLPFGGKKLLLVGDPFQMPPVIKPQSDRKKLKASFGGEYFFDSELFKKADPFKIELKEVYRQKDIDFCKILDKIRLGDDLEEALAILNEKCLIKNARGLARQLEDGVHLAFSNLTAQSINSEFLAKLPEKEQKFDAGLTGDFDIKSCLADKTLIVKIGATVMCIKNHSGGKYVNGTIGTIKTIENEIITIEDNDGRLIKIERAIWTNEEVYFKKTRTGWDPQTRVTGTCSQYPIKLGWALTIHKSQGLTFQKIFLENWENVSENSLIYVALSRCTTLQGVKFVKRINQWDIRIDERIEEFYSKLTSRETLGIIMTEIHYENILELLPLKFGGDEIERVITQNKSQFFDYSFEEVIKGMLDNNLIFEEEPNFYRKNIQDKAETPKEVDESKLNKLHINFMRSKKKTFKKRTT